MRANKMGREGRERKRESNTETEAKLFSESLRRRRRRRAVVEKVQETTMRSRA